jgi:hypothetical protein
MFHILRVCLSNEETNFHVWFQEIIFNFNKHIINLILNDYKRYT